MMALYIGLGVAATLIVFVTILYNRIISLRNKREQSFGDIDVQLKQRFDLVPNLVETVKGYAAHEKETLQNVTDARTQFLNANTATEKIQAENALSSTLKSLFAVAEAYPDLKANTNFERLQMELSDIENKIASARRFFNATTTEYNTAIETFPANIVAGLFGFKREIMFEIENPMEKENVKISF